MDKLKALLTKAQHSRWQLWLLNRVLARLIPFNAQHGFKIVAVRDNAVETMAPYQRRNFNHIRGIHACGIATIAEFAAGMVLISQFDLAKYRMIMANLEVSYHYQAKKDLKAISVLTPDAKQATMASLESDGLAWQLMVTEVYDVDKNHVATVKTKWQLKPWASVKTKL